MGRHQQAESSGIISFCDMRRYRLVRHERIHAVRPGHLACHAASVHRLLGNRGRMRSRFIQFGLRTKITFADTQAWLGHSGSPCFRDPCAFRGVRFDHFRHIVHDVVHRQQHEGIRTLKGYLPILCAAIAGVVGYITFVQAELMNAKTIASLLPFFVVSGVSIAGLTSDDPYWYNNNFSQLGDRTTFAARMFNSTLTLAGICIVIISYFAVSELITTYRLQLQYLDSNAINETPKHFRTRILLLSIMLTLAGIAFVGIGMFRYTPHPILHNVFARGLPCLMSVLMIALPWLAPQLSKVVYVVSDLAIAIGLMPDSNG